jgi:predicted transcriptional regulator
MRRLLDPETRLPQSDLDALERKFRETFDAPRSSWGKSKMTVTLQVPSDLVDVIDQIGERYDQPRQKIIQGAMLMLAYNLQWQDGRGTADFDAWLDTWIYTISNLRKSRTQLDQEWDH